MKGPCLRLCFAVLFGFAFAVGGIPSICAQESEESESDEFQLEEITVTAQKRSEDVQKVAIQMEVIQGEDLIGTGKDNMDDILRDVSNILINKNVDGMRITLRGLSDDATHDGSMHNSYPQVAMNIDGAYNSASNAGQGMFDVERVEVLAGPQSTLYGANSPGGVVNVVTASPKTDKFSGNVSLEFANYDLFDGKFALNAPIVQDLVAMRLAGQWYEQGSWMVGNSNEQETKTVRLKTLFDPSDTFQTTLTLNYSEKGSNGRLNGQARLFDFQDGHWADGTTFELGDPVTNPWTSADYENFLSTNPTPQNNKSETKGVTLEVNWDTDFGNISFVPSYSKRYSDDLRNDVEIYFADDPEVYFTTRYGENFTETKQAELRITNPEDFPFVYILGAVLYDEVRERSTDDYFYDNNDSVMSINQDKTAIYGNVTYPITDRFRANAGYRQSWDDVETVSLPPKTGTTGITGQKYDNPDYKVGIEYDLAENAMLYANYSTSYRIDPMAMVAGEEVDPQELTAYTAGAKSRFLDNTLQVNASAFYYDYYNKFFRPNFTSGSFGRGDVILEADYPHEDPDTGEWLPGTDFNNDGDFIDTNLQAGDERIQPGWSSDLVGYRVSDPSKQYGDFESYGVDVSVDWVPTPKDRVGLTASYLHTEWNDAIMEYIMYWVWDDAGYNYGGRPETYSPEWSIHASYRHIFDLGSFGTLIPQVDVQYKSEYDVSFLEMYVPFSYQEAHAIWNADLTFNHASDRWSVNAYVKNIDEYAAKTFFNGRGSTVTLGLTDPKLYGVTVSTKF